MSRRSALLGLAVLAWASAPAWAGAPTEQLRAAVDAVIGVLGDAALRSEAMTQERRAALRREAERIIDFEEAARRSLGRHWNGLRQEDRQEFVVLFANLLERSYIGRLEQYGGERITYAGDSVDGGLATVKTRFSTRQGTEIPVDYRMHRRGERWLVYDVAVEGVSLVANYRTQFNRIIQSSSYQDLVGRLRNAQGDLQAPGASPDRAGPPRS